MIEMFTRIRYLPLAEQLASLLSRHPLLPEHSDTQTPTPYICIALIAAAFVFVALLLWSIGGYHSGFITLNALGAPFPDTLWSALTLLGDTQVAFAVLLFVVYRYPQLLPATLIAAIPATLISHGLKHAAALERPAAILPAESYHLIGSMIKHGSFPSGHSTTAGVIAAMFIIVAKNRNQRSLLIALLTLVIVSRVMVAAHWPIDVLIGGALGLLCGLVGHEIAVQHRLCHASSSQWFALLLPFYAVLTMPFHDGGYPLGHGVILTLVLIATVHYLRERQRHQEIDPYSTVLGI